MKPTTSVNRLSDQKTNAVTKMLINYWPFIVLLLIAAFLRFYKIGYPFAVNGTDEGVHLMAAKMGANGFHMYSQINTVQGPLFLFIYSIFQGDIMACRSLSAIFSLFGILGVCLISYRIANKQVALLAGVFLAFNYYYIKESRLASMNMFATVLMIWAFFFLILFLQNTRHTKLNMMASGIFFALSLTTRLFAVIPLTGISIYLILYWRKGRKMGKREGKKRFFALFVFGGAIIATTLLVMSIYGIENTFTGMFLNNLHRPEQPILGKFSALSSFVVLSFVPFIFCFIPAFKMFRKKAVQVLLIWLVALIIWYMVQTLTWNHHYTLVVPPVCILGAIGVFEFFCPAKDKQPGSCCHDGLQKENAKDHPVLKNKVIGCCIPKAIFCDRKKAAVFLLVVISVCILVISNFMLVIPVKQRAEHIVAKELKELTSEEDYIISGDPIITNYADRLQVPEVVNLAIVKYPPVTSENLINLTEKYSVKAVVFTYNLSGQTEYVRYIQDENLSGFEFHKAYDKKGRVSDVEGEIEIAENTFNIYVRSDD